MERFLFSSFNNYTSNGIAGAIHKLNEDNKELIFICIGSDLVLGDSLGPLVGTMLKKNNISSYIYGTLHQPITAREIEHAKIHLKQMHPNSLIIAIDAAVGNSNDIGLIKIFDKGLKPGLGVDKNLSLIGDASIIGVVAEKSIKNYNLFNLTRLNLIYKMAEQIAGGIELYEKSINKNSANLKAYGA